MFFYVSHAVPDALEIIMNRHSLLGLLEIPVSLEKTDISQKNKEIKLQKVPAAGSRPLERILNRAVMWSIIPLKISLMYSSFIRWALTVPSHGQGLVPESKGGFMETPVVCQTLLSHSVPTRMLQKVDITFPILQARKPGLGTPG